MNRISLDPMKYGSEREFDLALTELKYIKNRKGKLTKVDFQEISNKYRFSIDFLKAGLKGLSFPNDYKITTSKWFPIMYSWAKRQEKMSEDFIIFKKRLIEIYKDKARIDSLIVVSALLLFPPLYFFLGMNLTTLFGVFLSYLSIGVPLVVELHYHFKSEISSKMEEIERQKELMTMEGMEEATKSIDELMRRDAKFIIHAPDEYFAKLLSAPTLNAFYLGQKKHRRLNFRKKLDFSIGSNLYLRQRSYQKPKKFLCFLLKT